MGGFRYERKSVEIITIVKCCQDYVVKALQLYSKKCSFEENILMNLVFLLLMLFSGGENLSGADANQIDKGESLRINIPDGMQGIWKMKEDTSSHNYFVLEKENSMLHIITYMDKHGDNRGWEHGHFFMWDVKGTKFIVMSGWDMDNPGLGYLKVNKLESGEWSMTAQAVTDVSIKKMTPQEAHAFLEKHLDDPAIYTKELHFRKKLEFGSWK